MKSNFLFFSSRSLLAVSVLLMATGIAWAEPGDGSSQIGTVGSSMLQTANLSDYVHHIKPGQDAPGDVIEVFANSWAVSPIGLVYDFTRDYVRYAHESEPAATIYDVDYAVPHALLNSYDLAALNPGWPSTICNRDGAGYDFVTDTYFLPDFNGDLSVRDDNIIEIDQTGTILNAWETDGADNDSYDASAIDTIIDIAVIPGSPPRYFVADAGTTVVMEIDLIKSGLFVAATWGTLNTFAVSGVGNPIGVDYDSEHDVLYVSDFNSTTIAVVQADGTLLDTFTCPCTAGYNTGVTYIEGSSPPEIWVTNFTDSQTTRCEAISFGPSPTPTVIA